jgi:hypothetical protein
MIRRILDTLLLRRSGEMPSMAQLRPNELRREVVQAERRRREARATAVSSPGLSEEERPPRERVVAPPAARDIERNSLLGALKTRAGMRQAWLMKEILDPPVGMRGLYRDR